MLCDVTSTFISHHETTNITPVPPSSDHMWGVRSLKGSECEQNVWNSQWSTLDRELLKSHLLDMHPLRMHFSVWGGAWAELVHVAVAKCRRDKYSFCLHQSMTVMMAVLVNWCSFKGDAFWNNWKCGICNIVNLWRLHLWGWPDWRSNWIWNDIKRKLAMVKLKQDNLLDR